MYSVMVTMTTNRLRRRVNLEPEGTRVSLPTIRAHYLALGGLQRGKSERGSVPQVLLQGHTLCTEKCRSFVKQLLVSHKTARSIAGLNVTSALPEALSPPAAFKPMGKMGVSSGT